MERFITAVQNSLTTQNWYSALYLALTLPDICARLESDDGKSNRTKFIAWYDTYMADKYNKRMAGGRIHPFLNGNDLYALRCAMLHEGGSEIKDQSARKVLDRFRFTVGSTHCNQIYNTLQLNVINFCNDVCESVLAWYKSFKEDHKDKLNRIEELVIVTVGSYHNVEGVICG